MAGKRIAILTMSMLMLSTVAWGSDISPNKLLEKVAATYESMKTYKSEGVVEFDLETGEISTATETTFSILLRKPNMYLISWAQTNTAMPEMSQSGAVWNDGEQPYLYLGTMNAYSKMKSDELALASATGVSGGSASTVPSLFLTVYTEPVGLLSRLRDVKIEGTEELEGEECYVLVGWSKISEREMFWVSKERYLIRKVSRSLAFPEASMAIPEMTEAELEEAIRAMGQEVTEESKKGMKEMMERSRENLRAIKVKGMMIEVHTEISSPELDADDFRFTLPEGAVFKDSLFDGVLGTDKNL